jgi:hypothetical protein
VAAADQVGGETSSPVIPELDPISPELVMVDPAIAPLARAMLPFPGEFRPGWAAGLPEVERPTPRAERPAVAVAAAPAPRRRRARRAARVLVLAVAAGAVFAAGYVVADRSTSSGVDVAARSDALAEAPPPASTTDGHVPLHRPATTTAAPRVTTTRSTPSTTAQRTTTAASRATTATTKRAPSVHRPRTVATRTTAATKPKPAAPKPKPKPKPATTTTRTAPKPPAQSGFVPARTWTWPPVAGATAYRVTFTRGAATFYRATTREPRLDLPARVKFTPGDYAWTVVPVVNGQPGAPIVRSTFTVG